MGASIYSHTFAGLGNYIGQKMDKKVEDAFRVSTYYRTPILVEELKRMGYTEDQVYEIVAKGFFLQYWSGQANVDPMVMNPLVRSFYPGTSHIHSGGTDLGREPELQAVKLYCMGQEGEAGVKRIQKRFEMFGDLFNKGFVSKAENVAEGVQHMRNAVDQVLETGKPTYVISTFPFRPGGHASDQNPAPDEMILDQYERFKSTLVKQICAAAEPGTTGSDLADHFEGVRSKIGRAVTHSLTGTNIMTRKEIVELSVPGTEALERDPGRIIEIPANYLLGKSQKAFAGMGADIYGKALNRAFDECDAEGRAPRYVHQENHHSNKTDTRGGVYGELNLIKEEHLDKFCGFFPQEAQVMQVGMGLRSVLPPGNRVFVKGPHTPFNEHARDHMKYASYRYADNGSYANVMYIWDGGSLATQ